MPAIRRAAFTFAPVNLTGNRQADKPDGKAVPFNGARAVGNVVALQPGARARPDFPSVTQRDPRFGRQKVRLRVGAAAEFLIRPVRHCGRIVESLRNVSAKINNHAI
jgi:hypothetical protein